ncbi:MAG: cupin domain-containing protein [Mariprofundaceae bacterium]|nr:cupin domain-containing protein [Mariprofundaceae bacterium]
MFVDAQKLKQFKAEKMTKVGLVDSPRMFCDLYCLLPGQAQKVHAHADSDKVYYVIEGTPTLVIGDEERVLSPGDLAYAEPGVEHGVRNDADAEAICLVFMTPRP